MTLEKCGATMDCFAKLLSGLLMSDDTRKLCVVCAWRASCAKRFNLGDDATLHCPDFTEDVTLRKRQGPKAEPDDQKA